MPVRFAPISRARRHPRLRLTAGLDPGLAGYVSMLVLGLFLPIVAVVGYLVIAVALIIPFGLRRAHRA